MKRKILSALAAITALALASCSMFNSGSEEDSSQPAYIKVGVKNISRSALPNVTKEDEFENFTLTGTAEGENVLAVKETWVTDKTSTAWAKMKEASIPVTEGAGYNFTLSAVKGGATWQGSCAKTIQSGKNTLTFTLSLSALSAEGKGNLEITLSLPVSVKAVEAKLTNKEDSEVSGKTEFKGGKESGSVSFAAKDIPSGNYLLTFSLFGDEAKTLKLGEWREYAGITKGLTSSSTDKISELEDIYTIDLELGEGTLQGAIPGSYTRYSDKISLPDAKKAGDTFDGWVDGNGEEITEIKKGTVGNITLKAKWLGGIYVTAEQVKNGELKTKLLEAKGANLKNVKVVLPEGITSIESSLFEDCTFLSEFTIPAGVTEIESSVFKGCSALSEIKIPANVKKIGASAFKDCTSLESFEYDGTAKEWAEVERGSDWHQNVPATKIKCTDCTVDLDYDGNERASVNVKLDKVKVSGDIELTFDSETSTFTAQEGFESYQWYIDGREKQTGKENKFQLSELMLDKMPKSYNITVIAKDADGKAYAAEYEFTVDDKVVKVVFVENADGSGDLSAKTKTVYLYNDESLLFYKDIFIRKGYKLVSWNTKADGTGTSYKVDENIPATENITLYAQWKDFEVDVIKTISQVYKELGFTDMEELEYFKKSTQPPAEANKITYFDDEKTCPLWYDEESKTLFYYLEKDFVLKMSENSDGFFANLPCIKEIELSDFDTSNVTDMSCMFYGCEALESLDLSKFDTSKVTDMVDMFYGCYALERLDLSKFDTSNVTGMCEMFSGCSALESLDLSKFDTSNVTGMCGMFYCCYALKSLDLSKFDTSNVTDMSYMFDCCYDLTGLDLSKFDTSNVTDMSYMFNCCSALESLDLSKFDTSNVTGMCGMFSCCKALTSLDLSKFNTSEVTDMSCMFYGCGALTTIYVKGETDWSSSTYLSDSTGMFKNCESLSGGAKTKYCKENPQDVTYARVDGGTDAPGYFTVKHVVVKY